MLTLLDDNLDSVTGLGNDLDLGGFLLLESGDYLLLESGDKIIKDEES